MVVILEKNATESQIENVVKDFKPDMVGVSCSFSMFELDAFEIVDLIKKIDKCLR